jgi:MFS family permease
MAADLMATGVSFTGLWPLFLSIAVLSVCVAATYISGNSLLLDAIPSARGTVMALNSAAIGAGSALGSLIGGGALAIFGDYADVYHLLGAIMLLALFSIGLGANVQVAPSSSPIRLAPEQHDCW